MARCGWVYILTSKPRGVLYIGVTADIVRRIWQHRNSLGSASVRDGWAATGPERYRGWGLDSDA